MALIDELREATRQRAVLPKVVSAGPLSPGWDHTRQCMGRALAERHRDELKARVGTRFDGQRVKWRVRPCSVCGDFYIDRDRSSNGDTAAQKRRARERKRAAREP